MTVPVAPTEYQMLANYSAEMGLMNIMSVGNLIDAHRTLRADLKYLMAERGAAWEEARKHAYEIGKSQVTDAYIPISELEDMTIAQLAERMGYID